MSKALESQSLESYLAQIERELRDLPANARADEMREIEAHLSALVLAGQQLENLSHAQATAVALKQFGAPRIIGRKLRKAWERKQPEAWWRAVLAPVVSLTFLAVTMVTFDVFSNSLFDVDTISPFWSILSGGFMILGLLLQFFGTGFLAGLISPKRGIGLAFIYCLYLVYGAIIIFPTFIKQAGIADSDIMSLFCMTFSYGLISLLAGLAGTRSGARRGRKLPAQIREGRKFLNRIVGGKTNVQI